MKKLICILCLFAASPAAAQNQATPAPPMGQFVISPAPCDSVALISNGWCVDVANIPVLPPVPGVPAAPIITGPFATITTNKVQLTGTGVAGDIIQVAIDNILDPGAVTVSASNSWAFNSNLVLPSGNHVATAIQRNAIGPSASSLPLDFAVK